MTKVLKTNYTFDHVMALGEKLIQFTATGTSLQRKSSSVSGPKRQALRLQVLQVWQFPLVTCIV